MKNPSVTKLIFYNLQSNMLWCVVLIFGLFFIFTGWSIASANAPDIKNLGDFYFIVFSGPGNVGVSMLELLIWFIPQMLFYYVIGDMAYGELSHKGHILLPVFGSRARWWAGKVITLYIYSLLFVLELFLSFTLGVLLALPIKINSLANWVTLTDFWPGSQAFSGMQLLLIIILIYASSLFALGSLQMALSFLLKRSIYSFLLIIGILLVSCFASIDQPWLVRWLPGAQSILVRHSFIDTSIPDFSLLWSISYNIILATVSVAFGFMKVKWLDITRSFTEG